MENTHLIPLARVYEDEFCGNTRQPARSIRKNVKPATEGVGTGYVDHKECVVKKPYQVEYVLTSQGYPLLLYMRMPVPGALIDYLKDQHLYK